MKKMISLLLALSILLTVSLAYAGTICPIVTEAEKPAGKR